MLSALALTAFLFTAKSEGALSGANQHYNTAWEAVYDHNPAAVKKKPNLVKAAPHAHAAAPASTSARRAPGTTGAGGLGYGSSALGDIPGVPYSFASCVAYRESTNGTNPAANGNVYGIIPASGYNVSGDSIAQQKQVFKQIYDTVGPSAWAADGC